MAKKNFKFINFKSFNLLVQALLVLGIFFNLTSTVLNRPDKYFTFNYWDTFPKLKKIYYDSVYKNKHGNFIEDYIVYSYSAGALIKGESPLFNNPEHPPLGKYLIGISILLFNNPNIIILLFAVSSLLLMFMLGKQIFNNLLLALLAPFLLSFEPLFKNQLTYTPLLDIIQLAFLLSIFYFFNIARSKKNSLLYILLSVVFLGFFISTKFFGTGITIVAALILPLLIHKDFKNLKYLIITLPFSVIILYLSYIKVLIDGYPFNRFLGIQKWVFLYNKGHVRQIFSIWPLLFFNKWFTEGKISYDSQWLISWPLTTLISEFVLLISVIKRKLKKEVEVLLFWSIFYLGLMSFADASARYFVLLLPVLYIISIYGVVSIYKLYRK